ncbi:MAG: DNA repair protein RecO [Pirellulales bacterium]|nr:DNA repair protein RecO [Pirellulales bacterium]
MAAEKATAIVLRVVDFSESSCIVTLYSREFGKLGGLAKGGRRLKGPFEAALDLLAEVRVVFLRKSSDALDLLTEAKLLRRYRPRAGDLTSLYAAYYVAELVDRLTEPYEPHPELFDLIHESLSALATTGSVRSILIHFELQALSCLGYLPSLDQCVECGTEIPAAVRTPFGILDGGVLCRDCRSGKKHVVNVSEKVLAALRKFADPKDADWRDNLISDATHGELRAVLNQYLAHLMGKPPKMHAMLGMLPA